MLVDLLDFSLQVDYKLQYSMLIIGSIMCCICIHGIYIIVKYFDYVISK